MTAPYGPICRVGLPDALIPQALELLMTTLGEKLALLWGPLSRAIPLLAPGVDGTRCLGALDGPRLVGLLAFQDTEGAFLNPSLRPLIREYGLFDGLRRAGLSALMHHTPAAGEWYVEGLAVDPAYRGQGLGTRLLELLEILARSRNGQCLSLKVVDTNPRAEALYRRLGFHPVFRESTAILKTLGGMPFRSATFLAKNLFSHAERKASGAI